mmetsp:Transcript_2809/g.8567  ORF Transcript_2809/g.8567 Transcript_2809/m.8567 type:complete len:257 (-) Transcript_2809:601-1371(-)
MHPLPAPAEQSKASRQDGQRRHLQRALPLVAFMRWTLLQNVLSWLASDWNERRNLSAAAARVLYKRATLVVEHVMESLVLSGHHDALPASLFEHFDPEPPELTKVAFDEASCAVHGSVLCWVHYVVAQRILEVVFSDLFDAEHDGEHRCHITSCSDVNDGLRALSKCCVQNERFVGLFHKHDFLVLLVVDHNRPLCQVHLGRVHRVRVLAVADFESLTDGHRLELALLADVHKRVSIKGGQELSPVATEPLWTDFK